MTRVSADGADFINWSDDGRRIHWSMGPTLYTAETAALFAAAPQGEDAAKFAAPRTGVSLSMDVPAAKPTGTVALTGARVVTMARTDGGIVDDATILIRGDRIVAVGPRGQVTIPAGATTVDVAGKTIIPGLVDAHAHGPQGEDELVPQQNWSRWRTSRFGTTTDPRSVVALGRDLPGRRDAAGRHGRLRRAPSRPARSSTAPRRRTCTPRSTAMTTRSPSSAG